MSQPALDADAIVRDVTDAFPQTVAVFLRRRMHCPGCTMAAFMTLGEAAASYGVDPEELIADLRGAVAAATGGRL